MTTKQSVAIYKAREYFTAELLRQPETGMGYQKVSAKRFDRYLSQEFIVYNAELIVELNGSFQESKKRILRKGYDMQY